MKKIIAFILLFTFIVCFCGCNNQQLQNNNSKQPSNVNSQQSESENSQQSQNSEISKTDDLSLVKTDNVKNVVVESMPEGYEYLFGGDDANAIADYLVNLDLITDFDENPDEYVGMTWVINIKYENGDTTTVYHFGNMFIRVKGGTWYKLTYEQANRFYTLLEELNQE